MHRFPASLFAVGAALLCGTLVPTVQATPLGAEHLKLLRDLQARQPPKALPEKATDDQKKYQPSLDFDKDGCYNTPAIDADGNVAEGQDHNYTGASGGCRAESDLDNNNVYVRTRCNNGWCAHLYDYYFEKDTAVQHVIDAGGHRHDWEHIAVFVKDGQVKVVAASQHGDYDTKKVEDVRMDDTHPKVVYNKDGGSTHDFRFANKGDDDVENAKHVWFRGALVDYDTGFPGKTRDTLMTHDFGSASVGIKDGSFKTNLDHARNNLVDGFNSG